MKKLGKRVGKTFWKWTKINVQNQRGEKQICKIIFFLCSQIENIFLVGLHNFLFFSGKELGTY